MSQEYHNYINLDGDIEQRQAFIADAVKLSRAWGWDWVKIIFDDDAVHKGGDSGKSRLDFYTRNFPNGLADLMKLHPETTLDCHLLDLSAEAMFKMLLKDNMILDESTDYAPFDHGEAE
jgi:hypothetical protein